MSTTKTRIRELLSQLGEEFSLEDFASKFNISRSTAKKYISTMLKDGYIVKVDDKYRLTERAKSVIESELIRDKKVDEKFAYVFTDQSGNPVVLKIDSINKLYATIKYQLVPYDIISYHIEKGYLMTWLREQIGGHILAQRVAKAKTLDQLVEILEDYVKE